MMYGPELTYKPINSTADDLHPPENATPVPLQTVAHTARNCYLPASLQLIVWFLFISQTKI